MMNTIKKMGKKLADIFAKYNENYSKAMSAVDKYAPLSSHQIYGTGVYSSIYL